MKRISYTEPLLVETKVSEAIGELAGIVGKTLGPSGRTILIEQDHGKVLGTKDGVTVAKAFESTDSIKNLVATAAREACERTVRSAGDGTTTAIVLADALLNACQDFLRANPQYSPQQLARDLKEIFMTEIKPALKALSRPIKGLSPKEAREAVRHVAMVSANHDAEIADVVAEAVEFVGEDGMVIAEEGAGSETTVEHQKGFPISSGLHDLGGAASASFITRTAYSDCVLELAYVVLYDGDVNDFDTIRPLLEKVVDGVDEEGKPLKHPVLLVAHGFSNPVLKLLSQNFRANTIRVVPLVTPRNGQQAGKQAFLFDLVAYVGGKVYDPLTNRLQEAWPTELGAAEKIKIGQHDTVLFAAPEVELVEKRIAELKDQMEDASDFDCDRIRYRIGQLTGGVATVYAGGATAVEAKERHARVVDAISAVRSAMMEGVIPGGGSALAWLARKLFDEQAVGALPIKDQVRAIYGKALRAPFNQILLNAGLAQQANELKQIESAIGPTDTGFAVQDALKGEVVDWYQGGIMDPLKVTTSALENAISVAQLLMTLGGVMVSNPTQGQEDVMAMQEALIKAVNDQGMES